MMKLKLLSALMLGSTLVACGGSSSGGGGGDGGGPDLPDDPEPEEGTQIEIVNETMPLREDFSAVDTADFFSESYKSLNTSATNTITRDDGTTYELADPRPSFYYPTCCFWEEDPETGELTGDIDPEFEMSWKAGNGYLALIDSARFSVGQILTELSDENEPDRKSETSDGIEGHSAELGGWGELDLSQPYRVSFCINDNGTYGSGFSNLEVYVDNNSGGNQDESFWSTASMLLRTPTTDLDAGNRLVVEVPGDTYLVDDEGNQVGDVLAVNEPLDGESMPTGTSTSFLQLRVSSGAFAVISDLIVDYQDDPQEFTACEVNTEYVVPPEFDGVPFQGLPLSVNLDMTFEEFFGEEGEKFLAFPDDLKQSFYTPRAGSSRMFIENNAITWGDGRFYVGHKEGTGLDAVGGIDLSQPYQISFDVVKANDAGGNFMIFVDNTESGGCDTNSVHGEGCTIYSNTLDQFTDGETVTIESSLGTETSFFQFRCDSGCGQPESGDSELGITIQNIVIQYQDTNGGGTGLINESFEGIDSETFFSVDHRHISIDASTPFYTETGGTTTVADGTLSLDSSRFTAGDRTGAPTAEATEPQGDMDLSQAFRIQFDVVAVNTVPVEEDETANFFVYLDNNDSSSSSSIHDADGNDSRIVNVDSRTYEAGQTYSYEFSDPFGTTESFLQFRCESGCALEIDNLIVEPM